MRNFVPTEQQAENAKTKIAKYLKKYGTDVIQTVMPQNIWILRQRTKGAYAYNPLTGQNDWYTNIRKTQNGSINISVRSAINWIYTHYDPTLNVVCFGFVTLNTYANNGDNDKRSYTWVDPQYVFFMVDGEKNIYNSNGEHVPSNCFRCMIKYSRNNYPFTGSSYAFWNLALRQTHYSIKCSWDGIIEYINKSPYGLMHNDETHLIPHISDIGIWSQASTKPRRTIKCAEEIEPLLNSSYELSDDELMAHPFLFTTHAYNLTVNRHYDPGLWCVEQQGDTAILHYYDKPRDMPCTDHYTSNTLPPLVPWKRIETLRIFITPKHVHVYRRSNDQWVRDTHVNSIKYIPYNQSYFINLDTLWTCERFKYIKTIGQRLQGRTDQIIPNYWIQTILSLITQPVLEALAKIGCYKTVEILQDENQIKANIKRYFGQPCTAQSPLKQLGLSVKQLRILEQYYTTSKARPWSDLTAAPKLIKEAYAHQRADSNKLDVSYLSEQTFTTALQQIKCLYAFTSLRTWYFDKRAEIVPFYHTLMPNLNLTLDEQEKLWNKYWHLSQKYPGHHILRTIKDTISTYSRLDLANRVPIDWNFNDIQQLEATHNNLITLLEEQQAEHHRLYMMQQEERNKELEVKMKKYEEQRKQLEYSDGTYSIVMPKKLAEITHEGSFLHHCVGGYIQSHATGSTTILFLRRNDDIDTPWFTVEVRNQTIVQIHGKYNAWLGSSDESFAAVPFIMRWIKKNQLLCASHILTETARGYSSTGTCRELPVIDE